MADGGNSSIPAGANVFYAKDYCMAPLEHDSILGDDENFYQRLMDRLIKEKAERNRTSILDDFKLEEDDIKETIDATIPAARECLYVNENGFVKLDLDKYEKKLQPPITPDAERAKFVRDNYEELMKKMDIILAKYCRKSSTMSEPDSSDEEEVRESMTEIKPSNRKVKARRMCRRMYEPGFKNKCDEKDSAICKEHNRNYASNLLRVIAFPSYNNKLFSPKFEEGAFAEDEDDVDIIEERSDLIKKSLEINCLELVQSENFDSFASDLENNPRINEIVPSIIEFLRSEAALQFANECLTLILIILKNPYRYIEFPFEEGSTYGNQQVAVAEYLINCLQRTCFEVKNKPISDKCREAIIMFARLHMSNLALIVAGFDMLLNGLGGEGAYLISCKALNVVTSVGIIMIESLLPQHFEKIYTLAVDYSSDHANQDLHFELLRAVEISLENYVEHYSYVEDISSENNLNLFYANCYELFESELSTHLKLEYQKLKEKKLKFEAHLAANHLIFKTEDGYVDLKHENLIGAFNRRPIPQVSARFHISDASQNLENPLAFLAPNLF